MHMHFHPLSLLSILATVPLRALATPPRPHWGGMRVKHAWSAVPLNWECLGHPAAESTIDLHIALKSQHENALIDAVYEVSNPDHPKYGAHLTKEQVADLVAPDPDALELVNSWLGHHGVSSSMTSMTHGGSWLTVNGVPVSQANDLLSASYQLYRHSATNVTVLRTISYGLPAELHAHVQTISPTTYFGPPAHTLGQTPRMHSGEVAEMRDKDASGKVVTMLSSRDNSVTPTFLRKLYEMEGYVPAAPGQNALGIAGFNREYPNPDDLRIFMSRFHTDGVDATYGVNRVSGGVYDPSNPGLEANHNIQYTAALTYPTSLTFYSTRGTHNEDDPFLNWINYLLKQPSIPLTVSASYGVDEDAVPPDTALSVCRLFLQLAGRGVSALVPSGDDGVGKGDCKDTSGNVRFRPFFPASCPFVTAVGGTTSNPEEAADLSGGGFSNYFRRPDYQIDAVATFLQNLGSKYNGLYNPLGRGIPDISAQALNFLIIRNGAETRFEGTSCSTPTVASVISMLNDYLISAGKRPLGFLNPQLYGKLRRGFNDIKSGSNPGCNTEGFSAIAEWDPVTGLGTPDFEELHDILDDSDDSD